MDCSIPRLSRTASAFGSLKGEKDISVKSGKVELYDWSLDQADLSNASNDKFGNNHFKSICYPS
jgi:hypothetical protein